MCWAYKHLFRTPQCIPDFQSNQNTQGTPARIITFGFIRQEYQWYVILISVAAATRILVFEALRGEVLGEKLASLRNPVTYDHSITDLEQ